MTRQTYYSIIIFILAIGIMSALSCRKEVDHEQSRHRTFMRVMGDPYTDLGTFISETNDGGILVAGVGGPDRSLTRFRFDAFGLQLETDSIDGSGGLIFGTRLKGGGFFLNGMHTPLVVRVSDAGQVLANTWFDASLGGSGYRFTRVAEEDGSKALYVAYTNGPTNGSPSKTYVSELSYDGVELRYFTLPDVLFGGKVLSVQVVRANANLLWLTGSLFDKKPFSWADAEKSFVAIYDINTGQMTKVHIYDVNDDSESDWLISSFVQKNGSIISLISGSYFAWDGTALVNPEFEVFSTSENGEPGWRKRVNIGTISTYPMDIQPMADGGFLITGYCFGKEFKHSRPFIVRLDKNGEVIMGKVVQFLGPAEFISCFESKDHRLLFTGYSYSHGTGKDEANTVIVATDMNGNLE